MHIAVFLLWHEQESKHEVDSRLLGVFSTRELAEQARTYFQALPAFRAHRKGFCIVRTPVDQGLWLDAPVPLAATPNRAAAALLLQSQQQPAL